MGDGKRTGSVGASRAAWDGGGLLGTTRVMSHDLNLAGTEGPSARTVVPYSPSGPYPPGHSPS